MKVSANPGMALSADVSRGAKLTDGAAAKSFYHVECVGADGQIKWVEEFGNLVVNQGLDELLDKTFLGSAYTAAWFVGLTSATPTIDPTDTLASKAWTEIADYDEGIREALVLGVVAGQSVDNSASKASFAINATVTVGGAFVCVNSTKSGTTEALYSVGAFAADKPLTAGDTLNVQVTLTQAAL